MGVPLETQVQDKQRRVENVLAQWVSDEAWQPPACSPETRFRNKAKLAVGGSVQHPSLGLALPDEEPVDLRECGIHEEAIWQIIPDLAGFVTLTGVEPYDPTHDRGSFKFIHVTANPDGELMLRFVVRSSQDVSAIRRALPVLQARLPHLRVASANVLPERKAALAGAEETALTEETFLPMGVGDVTLYVRSHSFFQTNSTVAAALYRQAREWADARGASDVVDIYCGVGGFALNLAAPDRRVRGIEVEPSAIECARRAAAHLSSSALPIADDNVQVRDVPVHDVQFLVQDGTTLSKLDLEADLVIVNPPRRGIGTLAATLNESGVATIIYSSCNPHTLASDLAHLSAYQVSQARLFDMFPHTHHCEVAVLLERSGD